MKCASLPWRPVRRPSSSPSRRARLVTESNSRQPSSKVRVGSYNIRWPSAIVRQDTRSRSPIDSSYVRTIFPSSWTKADQMEKSPYSTCVGLEVDIENCPSTYGTDGIRMVHSARDKNRSSGNCPPPLLRFVISSSDLMLVHL